MQWHLKRVGFIKIESQYIRFTWGPELPHDAPELRYFVKAPSRGCLFCCQFLHFWIYYIYKERALKAVLVSSLEKRQLIISIGHHGDSELSDRAENQVFLTGLNKDKGIVEKENLKPQFHTTVKC